MCIQKLGFFKSWEGCSWEGYSSTGERFRLRKNFKISPDSSSSYKVATGSCRNDGDCKFTNRRSIFAIEDGSGKLMAEVKKKQSDINGLDLGEDVLTMIVEPQVDHSFIMGIVIAYSLTKCKL